MTGLQTCTLKSYRAVQLFIADNMEKLSILPGFDALNQTFDEKMSKLDELVTQQMHSTEGRAELKRINRGKMTGLTLDVSRRIVAMATIENDLALMNDGKCTLRRIQLSRDTAAVGIASHIHTVAAANLARLGGYGVNALLLDRQQLAIDAYTEALSGPGLGKSERHSATVMIAQTMKEINALLGNMKVLLGVLSVSDAGLVSMFGSYRRVSNTGLRHLGLQGVVRDDVTGDGIEGVTLDFYKDIDEDIVLPDAHIKPVMVKRSGTKGGFLARRLGEGRYRVMAYKPGYVTQYITVYASHGVRCVMEVRMGVFENVAM